MVIASPFSAIMIARAHEHTRRREKENERNTVSFLTMVSPRRQTDRSLCGHGHESMPKMPTYTNACLCMNSANCPMPRRGTREQRPQL